MNLMTKQESVCLLVGWFFACTLTVENWLIYINSCPFVTYQFDLNRFAWWELTLSAVGLAAVSLPFGMPIVFCCWKLKQSIKSWHVHILSFCLCLLLLPCSSLYCGHETLLFGIRDWLLHSIGVNWRKKLFPLVLHFPNTFHCLCYLTRNNPK